ncbi:HupE/UreJ family protein [Catalinimonas niigatensis]|uniref:HupE/UreJ family protein n=1 Tax=Catalinimonas niigatensis TaxID=1397264 RepID=UPI002666F605|nr:HupE/UreJ family protein [Catalinimonas niigatensis]WPP53439.1 HupE/UreJ family protein [Catalinimonas niigatensis]
MSTFSLYFNLGLTHILDINGYDHILFVVALCAVYVLGDWKKVLIIVTAFTIGHSITLALSTLDILTINPALIEFLIPVTIFITALSNIFRKQRLLDKQGVQLNYAFALFFGLIHGMGFSNYLRSLLGRDESIVMQLLAFNIGLEIGQIIIVAIFLVLSFIVVNIVQVARRDWRIVISSAIAGIALSLMLDTQFW